MESSRASPRPIPIMAWATPTAGDAGNPANLPAGEIKIMYTLLGDANLDGTVNSEDFTLFSQNLGQSGMMWDDGDFNYDGTVNSEDFTPLSDNSRPVRPDRRGPPGAGVAGCDGRIDHHGDFEFFVDDRQQFERSDEYGVGQACREEAQAWR